MSSVNFDQVAADAMLKQLYDLPAMQDLSYSDRPFFALVNKKGGEGGNGTKIPLAIATSQGFAPTLAQAQAVLAAQDLEAFVVTPVVLLSVARISGLTLEASMTSKQAFAKGAKMVIDAAVKRLANAVSSGLFRDGSGTLATVGTSPNLSTGIVVLTNPQESVQFEVNQALQRTRSGTLGSATYYVIAVDRNTGTITLSLSLGGAAADLTAGGASATIVAADKLLTAGTLNLQVRGLPAWITDSSSALSTPFYGVSRAKDQVRLAGIVFDGTSLSVKDAIVSAISRVAREGGRPDYCFMDFESYTQLAQDLQANVIYTSLEGPGKVSFSGFRFQGPKGEVIVVPDRDVEPKTAWLLQMDTWTLLHANEGEPVFLDDNGVGQVFRTVESYDGREVRAKFYGNLACNAAGFNCKVELSA
jgi:hypothetical protein